MLSTNKNTNDIYRRLSRYVAPHWRILTAAFVAMALQALVSGYVPLLVRDIVGHLGQPITGPVWRIPLLIVVVFFLRGVMSFLGVYGLSSVGRDVIRELRAHLYGYYLVMPASVLDRSAAGALISKLTYDSEQIAEALSISVVTLVRDGLGIIVLIGVMLFMSWELTVLTAIAGPVIGVLLAYLSRAFRRYSARIQLSMGDVTQVTEESLRGYKVIKLFQGRDYENARFDVANRKNFRLHLRLVAARAAGNALTQYVAALAIAAVIFVAFSSSLLSGLSAALFIGFLTAMAQLLSPLKRLITVNAAIQRGVAGAQSLFATIDGPVEPDAGTLTLLRARGDVVFDDVSFTYEGGDTAALDHIRLHVPAGSTLALVGRSGSGKSTFAGLLARFHDVVKGRVLLDGEDIRDYRLADLRRQLSLVSQDIVLFDDTIANNIAYGGADDVSRAAIERAAEAAHVMEFAEGMPEGLDTRVGERGTLLSGGQRQRVAIARALLKDAPVLILDEATSALDNESEQRVQEALVNLMRGRTTLVIAHRLSTIEGADCIAVLRQGAVVESGTHLQLLAQGGEYAALHGLQVAGSPV